MSNVEQLYAVAKWLETLGFQAGPCTFGFIGIVWNGEKLEGERWQ